ncbi:MAG: hypothetical protein K5866_01595 [Treponema sp.]|nr:hypothetical protein [Treponema sp.]
MTQGFSTINENKLHSSLKAYYAIQNQGKTEVFTEGYIYDIVADNGEIIEIQTKNLGKLLGKINDALSNNKKIRVVHPVILQNTILTTDKNGKLISKRKSPKKGNIYESLRELTGIYSILLKDNFTLELVFVNTIEHRVRTEDEVQSENKRRRHLKNWIKVNKELEEILYSKSLKNKNDYLDLLPKQLNTIFTCNEVKEGLKNEFKLPLSSQNKANLLLWLLKKMDLIEIKEKKGRAYLYKIKE